MTLADWKDIPVTTRKNPKRLYELLEEELELEKGWDDLSVIERRSRHRRYAVICETVTDLPAWSELSPFERRNPKLLYKRIKTVVNLAVEPATFDISVSVKDAEDTAIQGATVTLTDSTDNTKTFTGTSGSAGGCTIKPTAGTYIVTASCPGFEDYTADENLEVNGNGNLAIVISLAKHPADPSPSVT